MSDILINRKHRIFVIDDEDDLLRLLQKRLVMSGYEVFVSNSGDNIADKIRAVDPDLIILDIMLPVLDGFQIKDILNQSLDLAHVPVMFLSVKNSTVDKVQGLHLGVEDYVTKPFEYEELLARIEGIIRRHDYYIDAAMKDGLLGIYNVAFFNKEINVFFDIAKRYKSIFSLVVVDLDSFKKINDTYGHRAGDFILKQFCQIAVQMLRRADIFMRYGGDEFVVIMPETNALQAQKALEKISEFIKEKTFYFEELKIDLKFSISIGISEYSENIASWQEMFNQADKRLYEDKKIRKL